MRLTTRQTLMALAAFAALLSASGLVLEHIFHVLPCQMCWWQRYAHYGIFAAALVGLSHPRAVKPALAAVLVASFAGLSIAVWQFAAQHGWLPFPASCASDPSQTFATAENLLQSLNTTKIIPCDQETFTLLGLSLAGWNIPAMLLTGIWAAMGLKNRS